ncbi:MAG: motility protein A [Firmicutes bacterium]|nr:motility protein A [Bacillota bacterium]
MDLATIIGVISGISLLVAAIAADGSLWGFWDVPSILVVLGGTVAATLVNHSLSDITRVLAMVKVAFTDRKYSGRELIDQLVGLAEKARREGLLAMEEEAAQIEDAFLRKGIQLIVDGTDPDLVRNVLEIELAFQEERHRAGQGIFEDMGSYAPAFGMIGTLIGLINMLADIDDAEKIAPGMALALITTLYGSVLANLIFLPIAGKLRTRSDEEVLYRQIMLEGILSIQAGENPRLVEEKLTAFLSPGERARTEARSRELEDDIRMRTGTVRGNV